MMEQLIDTLRERYPDIEFLAPPYPLGTRFPSPNAMCDVVIVGIEFDFVEKDWKYKLVDDGILTPPLWVTNQQLHQQCKIAK